MLAVIGILGVLMGLLFPAVQKARQRALDVAAKDMVSQVATAWTLLAQENKRLPSKDLIAAVLDNGGTVSDDAPFDMGPGPCNVLNWWEAVKPSAKGDEKAFLRDSATAPKYATSGDGVKKGDQIPATEIKEGGKNFKQWPPDLRLERTTYQKLIGIFPPWAERAILRAMADEELGGNVESEDDSESDKAKDAKSIFKDDPNCNDHGLVKVMLDFDGDGQIKVPGDYTESGSEEVVYATAVAFVFTEDGTRVIRSW